MFEKTMKLDIFFEKASTNILRLIKSFLKKEVSAPM